MLFLLGFLKLKKKKKQFTKPEANITVLLGIRHDSLRSGFNFFSFFVEGLQRSIITCTRPPEKKYNKLNLILLRELQERFKAIHL